MKTDLEKAMEEIKHFHIENCAGWAMKFACLENRLKQIETKLLVGTGFISGVLL